jgi:Thioesterase-like superfamily
MARVSLVERAMEVERKGSSLWTGLLGAEIHNQQRPVGAVVAGMALNAAGLDSGFTYPVSCSAQFLQTLEPGEMVFDCKPLRRSRQLVCMSVRVSRPEKAAEQAEVLRMTCWLASSPSRSMTALGAPDVPPADALKSIRERLGHPSGPYASFLDQRPVEWVADWETRERKEPVSSDWWAFRDESGGPGDVVPVSALRSAFESLVLGDLLPPFTGIVSLVDQGFPLVGVQTLELSGSFTAPAAPVSREKLVTSACDWLGERAACGRCQVWGSDGTRLATTLATYRIPVVAS